MSNDAFLLKLNNLDQVINKSDIKVLLIDSINNYYRLEQGNSLISFQKAKSNFLKIIEKLNTLTRDYNLITIWILEKEQGRFIFGKCSQEAAQEDTQAQEAQNAEKAEA